MKHEELPNYYMPIVKKEAARAIPAIDEGFNVFTTNCRPPMCYATNTSIPAYRVKDIQRVLHPDDFKEFTHDVAVAGELDGEPIVYALDYVRWRVGMEE